MIRYKICPGHVRSKNDNELHYITASDLISLYKVDPKECIIEGSNIDKSSNHGLKETLRYLYPRADGKYSLSCDHKFNRKSN